MAKYSYCFWIIASVSAISCNSPSSRTPSAADHEKELTVRDEFVVKVKGDDWLNWPENLALDESNDSGPCLRVKENSITEAVSKLAHKPSVDISAQEYVSLIGQKPEAGPGAFVLLRGFASNNSSAYWTGIGNSIIVHNDALGGFFDVRRHPCVALLQVKPSQVYTVGAYDL